jgi:hypothetical protein
MRALKVLKTKEQLAIALDLPIEEIDRYLSGEKPLPQKAFLMAIDIVANGRSEQI